MKKSTIVCVLIAYAMIYTSEFDGADLSNISVLLDFLISGAICAVLMKFWWNFINDGEKDDKDGWER